MHSTSRIDFILQNITFSAETTCLERGKEKPEDILTSLEFRQSAYTFNTKINWHLGLTHDLDEIWEYKRISTKLI